MSKDTPLYTRRGDDGGTVLFGGERVPKHHPRVTAYGEIDELNACLGVAGALMRNQGNLAKICERTTRVQCELFSIGAVLATPTEAAGGAAPPAAEDVRRLETWIDEACRDLAPLKSFILPGGAPLAAHLHVCRTVCRRAERCVVALAEAENIDRNLVAYLNRLSDLLFAWARAANQAAGLSDVLWEGGASHRGD
ncbi:MAG: cob(I)yrinic acid a,c-diamide adenosyltransferase [Phycisphaerae bacterium]